MRVACLFALAFYHFPLLEGGFYFAVKEEDTMQLMAITDNRQPIEQLAKQLIAIERYVDYIQLREKNKTAKEIMTLLRYLDEAGVQKQKLILNDRVDIAVCCGIPTVQLPEHGLSIQHVRAQFPHLRIGKSVHTVEGAIEAENEGAHYVLYGHCFMTNSKRGIAPNGLTPLCNIKNRLNIPVFAVGGIDVQHVPTLQAFHVDGIAVMSRIFSAKNLQLEAKRLQEVIQHGTNI